MATRSTALLLLAPLARAGCFGDTAPPGNEPSLLRWDGISRFDSDAACVGREPPEPVRTLCLGPTRDVPAGFTPAGTATSARFSASWERGTHAPETWIVWIYQEDGGTWHFTENATSPYETPLPDLVAGEYRVAIHPAETTGLPFEQEIPWRVDAVPVPAPTQR